MPFKFAWLCELLQELFDQRLRQRVKSSETSDNNYRILTSWYNKYGNKIERVGPSAIAFLSSVFPERRPDRVYNVQETRLSQIFGRALGLGASRARLLNSWRERHGADFPSCVEKVMAQCEFDKPLPGTELTLDQIDHALTQIACNSPFSSSALRARANNQSIDEILRPLVQQMQSHEAKWFVRLLLKSYSPVEIPEYAAMHGFHFMLPDLLNIQNSFEAAVEVLAKPEICGLPPRPAKEYEKALKPLIGGQMVPKLGVMVRRQPYDKARSVKHCCDMAGRRVMSVERKYDGEYVQIHIDLSKGRNCVQLFSKSGKDSTNDRIRLHSALRDSLQLDRSTCKIKQRCILEGELLVWNNTSKIILPFHKIRKHVKHGGRYLGTDQDSPIFADEQLMIMFFDILLLDEKLLLTEPHSKRRAHLKGLVNSIEGSAEICERTIINFASSRAREELRTAFASSITQRWEGFVIKDVDGAYFSWGTACRCIKLKKDYIAGLGESADLCIIGGSRDPKIETELGIGKLSWTTFYLACLTNKDAVRRHDAKPSFQVIDTIGHHSMPKNDILDLNSQGLLTETPYNAAAPEYDVVLDRKNLGRPTELFKLPFVVEIMGAGFERPPNCRYYVLRFPRKIGLTIKLHGDRTIADTTSFDELQEMAKQSLTKSPDPESQEDAKWIEKLLAADPRRTNFDQSQSTSPGKTPRSVTTVSLSPIQVRRRGSLRTPVFVRTDTECLLTETRLQQVVQTLCRSSPISPESAQSPASEVDNLSSKRNSESGNLGMPRRNVKKRRECQTSPIFISSNTQIVASKPSQLSNSARVLQSPCRHISLCTEGQCASQRHRQSPKFPRPNTSKPSRKSHSHPCVINMEATQANTNSKRKAKVLSENSNLPPDMQPPTSRNMSTDNTKATNRGSPDTRPRKTQQRQNDKPMSRLDNQQLIALALGPAMLPTPPSSSPQPPSQQNVANTSAAPSGFQGRNEVSHMTTTESNQESSTGQADNLNQQLEQAKMMNLKIPIYLTPSAATDQTLEAVTSRLPDLHASTTWSLPHFVDSINLNIKECPSAAIILDSQSASSAVDDLRSLADKLTKLRDDVPVRPGGDILVIEFYDYRVLRRGKLRSAMLLAPHGGDGGCSEEFHMGSMHVSPNKEGGVANWTVRIEWK